MSALIPAFLLVLLGDAGGNLTHLRHARYKAGLAALAGLFVGAAAAASALIAAQLTPEARLLLLGVALILAGFTRFVKPAAAIAPNNALAAAILLWRSTAPFTAFALATWFNDAIGATAGALAAMGVAVFAAPWPRWRLYASGTVLLLLGALATLNGLRLI